MSDSQQQLRDLAEIRGLMEDASRFLSLSGLSGVGAGAVALMGAGLTYRYLQTQGIYAAGLAHRQQVMVSSGQLLALVGIALLILACAVGVAAFFTLRRARRQQKKVWTRPARRMVLNMLIPLAAGAVFCVQLAWYGLAGLVSSTTLLFYGLALLNAGKYTFREIRYLGLSEIALGLLAGFMPGYGILFWAVGFGLLHMLYGLVMYLRYER
ncbi:MAG: hypothetical protein OHK0039_17780 [Bacteroidia bacterium]